MLAGASAVAVITAVLTRTPATPPGVTRVANGSSTPPFHPQAPPAGRPVVWLAAPSDQVSTAVRLRAVDWSGQVVGAEAFPCRGPCTYDASPDGSRVLVWEQPPEGRVSAPGMEFTGDARPLGTLTDSVSVWADDSRRLCTLRPAPPAKSPAAQLYLVDPAAQASHFVAELPPPPQGSPNPGGWQVLACSTLSDRGIVTVVDQAGVRAVRVLTLSTGRLVYATDQPLDGGCSCAITALNVSHDGAVAIETLVSGAANLVDLRTGATTRWPGPSAPNAGLTWTGRRTISWLGSRDNTDAVVEVPTGRVTWRPAAPSSLAIVAVRPSADDVMLDASSAETNGRYVIVFANGSQAAVPSWLSSP